MTPWRLLVAAVCGYEVFAIVSGRTPTISALCDRRRLLAAFLIGGLAVHLLYQPQGATS